ncbi:MAG TPA: SBBP repeat-containing protein, partial [Leptospiraceae bacterium]|nr:SBBP repeat-containing protein [Leptospiraceae bacterium]
GNIYVAGASRAPSPNCGIGSTAYWRPVLFRFNSSMSYIGCTFITVSSTAFAFGATASPNGESYISGYGSGTIDSIGPIGTTDGYFTKFDNLGNKLWTKRLGVPGAITTINSVVYEPNVNMIYITGLTNGNLAGTVTGTRDMFVAKYDPSGNQIWIKMQGINNDSIGLGVGDGTSIVFDQSKTMYSFGHTNGTVNGITNPAAPNNALFLVRNVQ